MSELMKSVRLIKDQTPSEKMYILKQMAYHMLGAKWKYYHKIKKGGKGLSLFKEKSLMEQMKATQSALRFTSKSAKKSYRTIYQATLNDIVANLGIKKDCLPALPEVEGGQEPPSLTSQFDEVIITWTPFKFFHPAKQIREKGKATQRHSEGLVAKLFFKVAAFYSVPDNWNYEKLSIYVRRINEDTNYQEISSILEPLKNDINLFVEAYDSFKFGQANLAKGAEQESDAFDDAMAVESFESQVRTLYWYGVIYHGIEQFVFRYFLTLITACQSTQAIRQLSVLFEPAFEKVIDVKGIFLGSFEIDRSKSKFRKPYKEYLDKRLTDPVKTKLKTGKGVFETYIYNLKLIEALGLSFDISDIPEPGSAWAQFIKNFILNTEQPELLTYDTAVDEFLSENPLPAINDELRNYSLMQLLATMVRCTQFRRKARHKILERFKKRVIIDKEFAEKQIGEIQKRGEKQLRKLEKKLAKIKRLKQTEAIAIFEKDVEAFKKKLADRSESIRLNANKALIAQKERLQGLFREISKEDSVNSGNTASYVYQLVQQLDISTEFVTEFLKYSIENVQNNYSKELEPFYENMFEILNPTVQEKIVVIQALKKSGGEKSINLALTPEEEQEFDTMVDNMKKQVEKTMPEVFKCKFLFLSLTFPIDSIFRISINNQSLKKVLRLKVSLPNTGKQVQLSSETAKALLVLNMMMNPVPANNLIMDGKEEEADPQKALNSALLNKLLAELN